MRLRENPSPQQRKVPEIEIIKYIMLGIAIDTPIPIKLNMVKQAKTSCSCCILLIKKPPSIIFF